MQCLQSIYLSEFLSYFLVVSWYLCCPFLMGNIPFTQTCSNFQLQFFKLTLMQPMSCTVNAAKDNTVHSYQQYLQRYTATAIQRSHFGFVKNPKNNYAACAEYTPCQLSSALWKRSCSRLPPDIKLNWTVDNEMCHHPSCRRCTKSTADLTGNFCKLSINI